MEIRAFKLFARRTNQHAYTGRTKPLFPNVRRETPARIDATVAPLFARPEYVSKPRRPSYKRIMERK